SRAWASRSAAPPRPKTRSSSTPCSSALAPTPSCAPSSKPREPIMWTPCSTASAKRRWRPNRGRAAVSVLLLLTATACSEPQAAQAQMVVHDPKNHVENALQAARQLESLSNEARMLANQARQLAASPYSHLGETTQTLKDIGELARSVRGIA